MSIPVSTFLIFSIIVIMTTAEDPAFNNHTENETDLWKQLADVTVQLRDMMAQQTDMKKQLIDAQADIAAIKKNDDDMWDNLKGQPKILANSDRLLSNPRGTCSVYNTPTVYCERTNSVYCLNAHDIRCPAGQVLTQFRFVDENHANSHYEFTCCSAFWFFFLAGHLFSGLQFM